MMILSRGPHHYQAYSLEFITSVLYLAKKRQVIPRSFKRKISGDGLSVCSPFGGEIKN
jgi:hypothetical protein